MSAKTINELYCDTSIQALVTARQLLLENPAQHAITTTRYGKKDTLGLDATTEILLLSRLKNFDENAIVVTEEVSESTRRRWPTISDRLSQPLIHFSDPTDRSKFLKEYITTLIALHENKRMMSVGDLMDGDDAIEIWERIAGGPASITGATGSITSVRKGTLAYTVVLNYITGDLFVAQRAGIFHYALPNWKTLKSETITLETVKQKGASLLFQPSNDRCVHPDDYRRFVTFMGKSGYPENLRDSKIFHTDLTEKIEDAETFVHHREAGGPARILYLSELHRDHSPIGFILANGEKISEWIHWLAFVKYAKNDHGGHALRIFEISLERPWTKDGILMSTSAPYSMFTEDGDARYLDLSRLRHFPNPSQFRAMLVVTPHDNERMAILMRQKNYREVTNFL